jgi:uncharacterized protein
MENLVEDNPRPVPENLARSSAAVASRTQLIHAWNLQWNQRFQKLASEFPRVDPAHDLAHLQRVKALAERLLLHEGGDCRVILPAVWLHDCVGLPKNHPQRGAASEMAARKAREILAQLDYPLDDRESIAEAIRTHSYSAQLTPQTVEAQIVQDADRLDALGALGLSRCLMTAGSLGSQLYDPADPWAETRPLDDRTWALDHFYTKLLRLPATFCTATGRQWAQSRAAYLQSFLDRLVQEIDGRDCPNSCGP